MKPAAFFISVLFTATVCAQDFTQNFQTEREKVCFFLGKAPQIPSNRLSIRIDTLLYHFYSCPELDFVMKKSLDHWSRSDRSILLRSASAKYDQKQSSSKDPDISKIDTSYRSKSITGNRLLALGNLHLNNLQANKVEWLDVDLSFGRITELEEYRKLRGLIQTHVEMRSECETHPNLPRSEFGQLRQGSDPFFWDDLQTCSRLEMLSLNHENVELLFLDENLGRILANGKMHSLYFNQIPYMPVNFHDFSTLHYISIWALSLPEAVNLAIVMNGFGTDTTGNWTQYLKVAKEQSVIVPETGTFTTHYVNDSLLCRGDFKDYLPNGKWEFYYGNGQLCQQRFYDMGKKTGNWLFLDPEGDTVSIFRYKDERLVYKENRREDREHTCDNYEFSYPVINTISYQLDWKNNREVTISKKERSVVPLDTQEPYIPAEDTLFTLQENWHFTHDEWEYAWIYECRAEKYITERYLKGQIGEVAYFTRKVDQNLAIGGEFRKTYMYNQISETTTDVKNNLYKEIESSDDNPEKVMRVIRTKRIAIRPEVERKKPKPLKKQEEENEGE